MGGEKGADRSRERGVRDLVGVTGYWDLLADGWVFGLDCSLWESRRHGLSFLVY